MAQLGDLIVTGKSRFLNTINTSEIDLTTDSTHYGTITPAKIKYQDGTYNQTELTGGKLKVKANQTSTTVTPNTLEISSSTRKLTITSDNITKTNDTWDGTNTSLTTAITNKLDKSGGTMTGNLTAPKFIGALQGNADTATNVAWSGVTGKPNRAGSDSDGGAANTLKNFQVSLTGSLGLDISTNSIGYIGGLTRTDWNYQMTDGAIYGQTYSAAWKHEIFGDYRTGHMSVRGKNNGSWQPWNLVLDSGNVGYIYSSTITYNPHERKFITSKSTSAWDTQVYSKQGYIDNVFIVYRPSQTNMAMMIGLDSNPSQDSNYTNIDYCWYTQNTGGLSIYESGTSISSATGHTTYAAGDELRIEYSGGYVRYYHNGALCRSVARSVGNKLYMDSSLHGATSTFYDVTFGTTLINATSATTATTASKLSNTSKVGDTNKPVYFTANGVPSAISYTIGKSVPSTAIFTDENVDQVVDTTTASDFRLLFSGTANDTETVTYVKKSGNLLYNPSTGDIHSKKGNLYLKGSIDMPHNGSIAGLANIELYCPSTSGNHGGFIDFHWNQSTADYTARLIETGSKGTIKAYNSISNASDRRLKDNIVDIDDKYVGLLNIINAKQYNFKSSEDKTDLGFIAQEVEDGMKQIGIADDKMPIISKPTDNDVDKYYGLDYSQMTALLWKICQVQQKEINELKNK